MPRNGRLERSDRPQFALITHHGSKFVELIAARPQVTRFNDEAKAQTAKRAFQASYPEGVAVVVPISHPAACRIAPSKRRHAQ